MIRHSQVKFPDGRRHMVTYYVDCYSGYFAKVKYEYHANYDHKSAYKPAYKSAYKPGHKTAYKAEY